MKQNKTITIFFCLFISSCIPSKKASDLEKMTIKLTDKQAIEMSNLLNEVPGKTVLEQMHYLGLRKTQYTKSISYNSSKKEISYELNENLIRLDINRNFEEMLEVLERDGAQLIIDDLKNE